MRCPRLTRRLLCWRRAVLRLAAALWLRLRGGPLVDDLGYPTARHPEDPMAELPGDHEEWLAGLAAGLWPDDEYARILRCYPPGVEPGGDQR